MKHVRALGHMTQAARAVLERMAEQLEQIAAKGNPLSVADEVCSWGTLLAASQILSGMDSTVMTDEVVKRLSVAVDLVEALAHDTAQNREQSTWIN